MLARAYKELGVLPFARVYETAAAGMAGSSARETADLVHDAAQRGGGRVLLVTGAHSWRSLPDGGAQVLRALYEELSEARHSLAVVLAGEADPVAELMGSHPPLAARFPLAVSFPGYSGGQLGHVLAALAAEAGFTLDAVAAAKAGSVWCRGARLYRDNGRFPYTRTTGGPAKIIAGARAGGFRLVPHACDKSRQVALPEPGAGAGCRFVLPVACGKPPQSGDTGGHSAGPWAMSQVDCFCQRPASSAA